MSQEGGAGGEEAHGTSADEGDATGDPAQEEKGEAQGSKPASAKGKASIGMSAKR